jgi:hypothetical protein
VPVTKELSGPAQEQRVGATASGVTETLRTWASTVSAMAFRSCVLAAGQPRARVADAGRAPGEGGYMRLGFIQILLIFRLNCEVGVRRPHAGLRSDLNAARISSTNSFGCSQAAKCVPLGKLL